MAFHDLELRHLAALRAVARHGTFARAAQQLGFTQSAISQQISALERAAGTPVFDRLGGARGVALTPAGRLLLGHAERILDQVDEAAAAVDHLLAGIEGTLVIGTFQSVSVKVLPEVIGRLRKERPALEITLFENDDQEILNERLRSEDLDLTFSVLPLADESLTFSALCEDPFVVLCPLSERGVDPPARPPGHRRPVVPMAQLSGLPLIGQPDVSCQVLVEDGLRSQGIDPNYVFRSSDNGAVQAMVRAGMGRAVMAYLAIEPDDPEIVVADLDPPLPPRHLGIASRAGTTLSPGATRFIEIATDVCTRLTERLHGETTPAAAHPGPHRERAGRPPRGNVPGT